MYLFSRNIIYNSQDTEAIHMSINRQLGSEDVAYNGIVLSHKKNEILPFAAKWTWTTPLLLLPISRGAGMEEIWGKGFPIV